MNLYAFGVWVPLLAKGQERRLPDRSAEPLVILCATNPTRLRGRTASTAPEIAGKTEVGLEQVWLTTWEGAHLDGIVYRPVGKPKPLGHMLVHGFDGNFYVAYFPYVGRAAAQEDMVALALNMRDHDTGRKAADFADNQLDIAVGVGHLHSLGASKIVLRGQTMGTNHVLYTRLSPVIRP